MPTLALSTSRSLRAARSCGRVPIDKEQHPAAPPPPGAWPPQEHVELHLKCDSRGVLPAGLRDSCIEEDYADLRLAVGINKLDEVTDQLVWAASELSAREMEMEFEQMASWTRETQAGESPVPSPTAAEEAAVEVGEAEVALPCQLCFYTQKTILDQALAMRLRKSLPLRLHLKEWCQICLQNR